MVAIADVNAETDLEDFYGELKEKLAPFARPLFIRILKEMDMTGRNRSIDADGIRAELCFPREPVDLPISGVKLISKMFSNE